MSDALAAFLSDNVESTPKAYVRDKAPLVCLVLYINLEFDDEKHRVEQINFMFSHYQHDDYMDQLIEAMESDKDAITCYQTAVQAVQDGLIEKFDPDFDTDRLDDEGQDIEMFYMVSFLAWAEQAGFKLPEYVMLDLDYKVEMYYRDKHSRDEARQNFLKISKEGFEQRIAEPLWVITDALLYLLGYKNKQGEDKKVSFLKYKKQVKQIIQYVQDAQETESLKLYNFSGSFYLMNDKDFDISYEEAFFTAKVKPKEFVEWARSLPMDLPIFKEYTGDNVSNENEPPPAQESVTASYQIKFLDVSGELVLNDMFTLARPTSNGQNYRIIRYLIQNQNRFVTADELKEKALDGKPLDKRPTDFVAQINMNKDMGKLFFDTSKDSIRLNNPVTPERMAEQNIKRLRVKPA